jgi:hypothetical protein
MSILFMVIRVIYSLVLFMLIYVILVMQDILVIYDSLVFQVVLAIHVYSYQFMSCVIGLFRKLSFQHLRLRKTNFLPKPEESI